MDMKETFRVEYRPGHATQYMRKHKTDESIFIEKMVANILL